MKRHQEELGKIVQADPDVASVAMAIGGRAAPQQWQSVHHAEAARRTQGERAADHRAAAPQAGEGRGARLLCRRRRTCASADGRREPSSSSRCQDADLAELNEWAPKILAKMQTLPELRDVATDQQTNGTTLELKINRDTAARYGIKPQLIDDTLYDAFGQRGDAIFYPAQHLQGGARGAAGIAGQPRHAEQDLREIAHDRRPGAAVDLRDLDQPPVRPLSISHQGQFPAITISFNLGQGVALDRRPTPCRRPWSNSARRLRSIRASRAPHRPASRSAPCRC